MLNNLLNELTTLEGKQLTLCQLDNYVMSYGLDSVYNDANTDDILENESVSYEVGENQWINILFDTVEVNEDSPIDTVVKIKNVEEI